MAEFAPGPARDGVQVLTVSGDVDIDAVEEFLTGADECLQEPGDLELDLGGVTFIDSSGLGALVKIQRAATERGRQLTLTSVPASVERILQLTGLDSVLHQDQ